MRLAAVVPIALEDWFAPLTDLGALCSKSQLTALIVEMYMVQQLGLILLR